MAKVKKATRVTGERNKKAGKGSKGAKGLTDEKRVRGKSKQTTTRTGKARQARTPATRTKSVKGSPKPGTQGRRKAVASGVKGKRIAKKATRKPGKGRLTVVRGRRVSSDAPVVTVAIRELDPLRKCGPNTTVQFLYRVDESVDGRRTAHLVFFDRHGWYCEHGRTCPAVGHAKKYNGRIARVS